MSSVTINSYRARAADPWSVYLRANFDCNNCTNNDCRRESGNNAATTDSRVRCDLTDDTVARRDEIFLRDLVAVMSSVDTAIAYATKPIGSIWWLTRPTRDSGHHGYHLYVKLNDDETTLARILLGGGCESLEKRYQHIAALSLTDESTLVITSVSLLRGSMREEDERYRVVFSFHEAETAKSMRRLTHRRDFGYSRFALRDAPTGTIATERFAQRCDEAIRHLCRVEFDTTASACPYSDDRATWWHRLTNGATWDGLDCGCYDLENEDDDIENKCPAADMARDVLLMLRRWSPKWWSMITTLDADSAHDKEIDETTPSSPLSPRQHIVAPVSNGHPRYHERRHDPCRFLTHAISSTAVDNHMLREVIVRAITNTAVALNGKIVGRC